MLRIWFSALKGDMYQTGQRPMLRKKEQVIRR